MSEVFDPENVWRFDCELGSHYYGEPLAKMVPGSGYVAAADYDKLLALRKLAIDCAVKYGGMDGDHHKAWVIDQMVRALAGDVYDRIVAEAQAGEDGPNTYEWNIGIAP